MADAHLESEMVAVQLELENVNSQLESLENNINILLQKQSKLIEEKEHLTVRLNRIQFDSEKSEEGKCDWSSDDYLWSEEVKRTLQDKFNINEFRSLQKETMNVTLSKRDCILIMPTGGGKSLCFQLPAIMSKGFTLVISPLVSLMEDQMLALQGRNIHAEMLNASIPTKRVTEIQNQMTDPDVRYKLLYVTPEKLAKSKRFMAKLEKAYAAGTLERIVIDEVHCASHWGHDFRPDYKILGVLKRQFPNVPLLGLTATASEKVLADVKEILNLDYTCVVFRASFNRPNLFYEVRKTSLAQKDLIKEIAERIKTQFCGMSGIVYCFSRKDSADVASLLTENGVQSHCYHADLPPELKSRVHQSWTNGNLQVVVATIAFGMGIDKPNVRFVIHYSISKSMENYYQESGRAGRDSQKAHCILYFRFQDIFRQSAMVFTEKTGLQNLHHILTYSLNKSACRRTLIGGHFAENWSSSKCHLMCDNCERMLTHVFSQRDLTEDAKTIVGILQKASSCEERLTAQKIIDAWLGKGKSLYRANCEASHSRNDCECIVSKLLLEGILKEDFHFTPYSTITYLVPGPRWPLLDRGQISVTHDIAEPKTPLLSSEPRNSNQCLSNKRKSHPSTERSQSSRAHGRKKLKTERSQSLRAHGRKKLETTGHIEVESSGERSSVNTITVSDDDDNEQGEQFEETKMQTIKKRYTIETDSDSDDFA